MKKNILLICDPDENYCRKLDGFLRSSLRIPFEICCFTSAGALTEFREKDNNLLIISESMMERRFIKGFKNILILDERKGLLAEEGAVFGSDEANIRHTNKYQSSEKIVESILEMCLEIPDLASAGIRTSIKHRTKIVGFYTPDPFASQTAEAMNFAEDIGKTQKVLLFTNDPFCTEKQIRCGEMEENLSDLMYYSQCEKERFSLYLEKIVRRCGDYRFIPASCGQISDCTGEDYIRLLRRIEESSDFELVVADFHETVPGLAELLKMCDMVCTLSSGDEKGAERIELFRKEIQMIEDFEESRLFIAGKRDRKGIADFYYRLTIDGRTSG